MDRGRVVGGDRDKFSSPLLRASGIGLVIGLLLAGLVASGGAPANAQVRVPTTLSTTLTVGDGEVDGTLTTLVETVSTVVKTVTTVAETVTTVAKTVTTVAKTVSTVVEETADTVGETADDPVVKTVDSVVESVESTVLPTATTLALLTPTTTAAATTDTTEAATDTTVAAKPIEIQMSTQTIGAGLRQTACDTRALGLDPQAAGPCPNDPQQAPAEVLAGTLPGTDGAPPPVNDLAARIRALVGIIQELLGGGAMMGAGAKLAEALPFSGLAVGILAGLGALLVAAGRGTLGLGEWLRLRQERDGSAPAEVLAETLPSTDSTSLNDLAPRMRAAVQVIQESLAGDGGTVMGSGGKLAEAPPFSGLAAGLQAGLGELLVTARRGMLRLDDWLRRLRHG